MPKLSRNEKLTWSESTENALVRVVHEVNQFSDDVVVDLSNGFTNPRTEPHYIYVDDIPAVIRTLQAAYDHIQELNKKAEKKAKAKKRKEKN